MNKKLVHKVKDITVRPGIAVLLVVLLIGVGAIQYANGNYGQPTSNQISPNVTVSDTTCIDYKNNTVCYNSENRSEVNLSQLTSKTNQTSVS